MPSIKEETYLRFLATKAEGRKLGETQDCTVVALSLALNSSYHAAREALTRAGRRHGQGARMHSIKQAIIDLGWTYADIVQLTHGKAKTTISALRWLRKHANYHTVIICTTNHIMTFKDGHIFDYESRETERKHVDELLLIDRQPNKPAASLWSFQE